MTPTRHTMSVLAQITSWIPDRIIENLAKSTGSRPGRSAPQAMSFPWSMPICPCAEPERHRENRSPSAQSHPKITHFIKLWDGCENNFEPRKARNTQKTILNHECTRMEQVESREEGGEGSAWLARVGAPARRFRRASPEVEVGKPRKNTKEHEKQF